MARTTTARTAPTTTDTAMDTTTEAATAATVPAPHAAALVELREIAVADIATDGSNPRTLFDLDGEAGLRELAASIKAHGLVQPITVRANLDAGEGAIGVHDLATLAAYTLVTVNLGKEDWGEIARRHDVDAGALMRVGGSTRPSADHIKELRTLNPLGLVKATIEALLIRQAQAARDYEPDNHYSAGPDPVFKLYTGDQTSATVPPAPLPPTFAPGGGIGAELATDDGDDDDAEVDPSDVEGVGQDAVSEEEDIAEDDA